MDTTAWYIYAGILFCFVALPKLIIKCARVVKRCKEEASKPFVCPNCGHRFYVKPIALSTRVNYGMIKFHKEAILKCPECNTKDRCQRPYDEE